MQVNINGKTDYIDGVEDILRLIRDTLGDSAHDASARILHQIEQEKREAYEAVRDEEAYMEECRDAMRTINEELRVIYQIVQEARIAKDTKNKAQQAFKNIKNELQNWDI